VQQYLINNRWSFSQSERRREELKKQRALADAEEKLKRKEKTPLTPFNYQKGLDFLVDVVDDNNYVPKKGEKIVTDKVDF